MTPAKKPQQVQFEHGIATLDQGSIDRLSTSLLDQLEGYCGREPMPNDRIFEVAAALAICTATVLDGAPADVRAFFEHTYEMFKGHFQKG
jgi:hypothetical protein